MTTSVPSGDTGTHDGDLLADLFDNFLQDILEERTPDLERLYVDRPDLRDRIAKTWALACSVAGRREPSRPVFGGYEIIRELGHGGMGTVYLARHQTLQRDVAVKVLPQSLAMSPRAKQRFLEEARALAQLRHDNVVHVHRVVDHTEMLAFEIECIDGPSLQQLILSLRQQAKPYSVAALAACLCQPAAELGARGSVEWFVRLGIRIARALGEVHRSGLVHRDVKPSNILLRRDGTPVLADFGLALGDLDNTSSRFAGTPVYAAPERLRGSDDKVDARTDIYSLGATLFEALTLSAPYEGTNSEEVLRRIEAGRVATLRQRAPHVPRDLAIVVQKAMEPDPRRRYETADELADDLERLLSLQPIQARPSGPLRRSYQFLRRHSRIVTAAMVSATLATALLWPLAARAANLSEARAVAATARHEARSRLLCSEALPASWMVATSGGQLLERSTARTVRLVAVGEALQHYDAAVAATPNDVDLVAERAAVQALAAVLNKDAASAPEGLPPLCASLLTHALANRGLADIATLRQRAADPADCLAAGWFAFLCSDPAVSQACWNLLPADRRTDPLIDACLALQVASDRPEVAYTGLFHAARAFPKATALTTAMAEAAIAAGDLRQAREWLDSIGVNTNPIVDAHRQLLAADVLAASGHRDAAKKCYRELVRAQPGDPVPLQRLADLALFEGDGKTARRLFENMLARWPDFPAAHRQLARLALQRHDVATFLSHARSSLSTDAHAARDHGEVLRLGGLHGLYQRVISVLGTRAGGARHDDTLPLASWLRPDHVAGIEAALFVTAVFDRAKVAANQHDARPFGADLRSIWYCCWQLPQLTMQLPGTWRAAALFGIPALLGEPTDRVSRRLLLSQRSLGDRFVKVVNRQLVVEPWWNHRVSYASALLNLGDLDGDTLDEFCVSAPPTTGNCGHGYLELRDLADGRLLRTWTSDAEDTEFARSIAVLDDVDGDLCRELVIGQPLGQPKPGARAVVELWSGRTGVMIWRREDERAGFGAALATIGDIDGDGADDVVIGAPPSDFDTRGHAMLCSGRTGALLHELRPEREGTWFGAAVASAGDANGDGVDDVVVSGNFGNAPGLVSVFSGRDGTMLTSFSEARLAATFGHSALGVADLDGDGRSELIVTAPALKGGGADSGKVLLFSSRTGRPIYELRGERPNEGFGCRLCLLPDWRGDQKPALAVAARRGGPLGIGYVRVFDLASAQPLQTFSGSPSLKSFGESMIDLGDRNGDNLRELGITGVGRDGGVAIWAVSLADAPPQEHRR